MAKLWASRASCVSVLLLVTTSLTAQPRPANPYSKQWEEMTRARRADQPIDQLLIQTDVLVLRGGEVVRGNLRSVRAHWIDLTVERQQKSFRMEKVRSVSLSGMLFGNTSKASCFLEHLRKGLVKVEGAIPLVEQFLWQEFEEAANLKSRDGANWARVVDQAIQLVAERARDDILAFEAVAGILSNTNLAERNSVQAAAASALANIFARLPADRRALCAHQLMDRVEYNFRNRIVKNADALSQSVAATLLPQELWDHRQPVKKWSVVDQKSLPTYTSRAVILLARLLTVQPEIEGQE